MARGGNSSAVICCSACVIAFDIVRCAYAIILANSGIVYIYCSQIEFEFLITASLLCQGVLTHLPIYVAFSLFQDLLGLRVSDSFLLGWKKHCVHFQSRSNPSSAAPPPAILMRFTFVFQYSRTSNTIEINTSNTIKILQIPTFKIPQIPLKYLKYH